MRPGKQPNRQVGFTYLMMLFVLAVFSVGLAALGESWSRAKHRELENELLEVGQAYVQAIGLYYESSPGSRKHYPASIEELTDDQRFVGVRRYLRRAYLDPITVGGAWGIVRAPDGGVMGIYSMSNKPTLMRHQYLLKDGRSFVAGEHYSDWKFVNKVK